MLIFKNIKYKNFLSTGNVPVEIPLNQHRCTTMAGKNGHGKSTVIDALYFAMYGKTFRKLKKDQILNSINKKMCLVELEFSNSGHDYKIIRGLSPAVFELYVDGVLKEQDASVHDYQTYIETTALKINQRTMKQVAFIGSSSFVPFMELKAAERRTVVEELLDIQIFSVMNNVLKTKASKLAAHYAEAKALTDKLKSNLEIHEKHLAEKNKQVDEIVFSNNQQIELIEKEIASLDETMTNIRAELAELIEQVPDEKSLNKIDKEVRHIVSNLTHNKNSHEKELSFFKENDDCPTCQQVIDSDFKKNEIEERQKSISKLDEGLSVAEEKLVGITKSLELVAEHQAQIYKREMELSTSDARKDAIAKQMKTLDEANEALKKDVTERCSTEEFDSIAAELKEASLRKSELSASGEYYSVISSLLKDNGIKSAIIKNYIGTINSLIKKYMEVMGFNCEFTFDEEFNETMKSRYRDKFTYSNFSTGQQLRISLSILFAFRELAALKNSAATNILILDEIHGSSLDDEGKEAFLKIVSEATNSSNVLLISHDPSIDEADFIDRRITFELKDNFTTAQING